MNRQSNVQPTRRRLATLALVGAALLVGAIASPAEAHRTVKVHVTKQHPVHHRHTTRVRYRVGPLNFSLPVRHDPCHRNACTAYHSSYVVNKDHVMCRWNGAHFVNNRFGIHIHARP